MKSRISILLVIILVIGTIMPGLQFPANVMAGSSEIVSNVSLVDGDGNPFTGEGSGGPFMKVEWSVEGVEVDSGSGYPVAVPSNVIIDQAQDGVLYSGEAEVGSYLAKAGSETITLTFNESILENKSANGEFQIAVGVKEQENDSSGEEQVEEAPVDQPEENTEGNTEDPVTNEEGNDQQGTDPSIEGETEGQEPADGEEVDEGEGNEKVKNENETPLSETGTIITENILTDYEIKYEKTDGTTVGEVDKGTQIGISYQWALENGHGYGNGSIFEFSLPAELKVHNEVVREEIYFNNEIIGYFTVTMGGTATIEFTDLITQYSNINGEVKVWTEIREETVITGGGITITPIEGQQSFTIPIIFNPGGSAIEKKGVPNRSYNGETITWTVDFNKTLESLSDAELVDIIEDGQILKEDSMKLYKLITNWNGDVGLGDEVTSIEFVEGSNFTIRLGTIDSAYRLIYDTEITDGDAKKFSNTATLKADGKTDVSAKAEVTIQRGKPLEKKVKKYNEAEQSIEWEVRYNYNEKKISQADAVLRDLFTDSQELIDGSVVVKEVEINPATGKENGSTDFSNYTVTGTTAEGKSGFDLAFNQDVEKAYKITYKTKAKERVYEDTIIKNEVAAGIYDTGEIGKEITPQILSKSHGKKPDYASKEIDWTIRVNRDQHIMKDVVIKDTFTNAGLTFLPDTVAVTEGGIPVATGDYTVNVTDDKVGFTLTFNKDINKEVIITYNTKFDYEERADKALNYLENQVDLTWKDSSGQDKDLTAKAAFTPDSYTQSNGFKNGSYNAVTKEITWEVGINYNLQTLVNAVVKDTIEGNQKLIEDSIKVYKMSLTGGVDGVEVEVGEAVKGEDYEIQYLDEKIFRIVFNNPISTPYKIEYKTSVDGVVLVADKYRNTAILLNGKTIQNELNAEVAIPYGGKYTEKKGEQKGKVIDWVININFAQSHVDNATVLDQPDEHQVILPDSLTLFSTKVAENGKVEKDTELVAGTDYTVEFTENPDSFKLSFTEKVSAPYILEYQTRIIAAVGADINNLVTFSGDRIDKEASKSVTFQVKRTAGMGSGTGELGALTVVKTDASTEEPLEGATFSLIDPESKTVIATDDTDESGIIQFDRLLYGKYTLKEVTAPKGYIGVKDQTITIDKPFVAGDVEKKGNKKTVKNKKIIRAVQLEKVNKDEKALSGAEFTLEFKKGDRYETVKSNLVTDDEGLIKVEDLEPGEYRFIETKAPLGYQLDATPREFTIGDKDTKVQEVRVVNLKTGSVLLKKVDKDDESILLEGAEFKLLDGAGKVLQTGLKTNEKGELVVSDLQPGTYQFVETKAPHGYKLDETPREFKLEAIESPVAQIEFTNEIQPGGVLLTKVDFLDSTKKLENAKFSLLDEAGNLLSDHTTNANGQIMVEDLRPGNYTFVETEAPTGYESDDTPIAFTIEKGQTEVLKLEVKNKATGKVVITKVDGTTNQSLAGAEFRLENEHGHVLIENLITNNEGMIVIPHMAVGNYKLFETKAPNGYVKISKPIEFSVEDGQTDDMNIIVKNTKAPSGGGGVGPNPPTNPEEPSEPGTPGEPSDPGAPGDPSDSGNPGEPGKPGDPDEPGNPGEPGKPGDPSDPGKPGEPGEPGTPGDPSNPGTPGDPDNPVDLEDSNDSGNLGTPEVPLVDSESNNNGDGPTDQKNVSNQVSVLPQTGQTQYMYMVMFGLLCIIVGGYVLVRKPKRKA